MERTTSGNMDKRGNFSMDQEPKEGETTKTVEQFTARIPSLAYLGLAVGSMVISASLAAFTRRKTVANFIGLWVPTIMLVGIYNKLVKLEGSDRFSRPEALH
jgi:hypothetical protein